MELHFALLMHRKTDSHQILSQPTFLSDHCRLSTRTRCNSISFPSLTLATSSVNSNREAMLNQYCLLAPSPASLHRHRSCRSLHETGQRPTESFSHQRWWSQRRLLHWLMTRPSYWASSRTHSDCNSSLTCTYLHRHRLECYRSLSLSPFLCSSSLEHTLVDLHGSTNYITNNLSPFLIRGPFSFRTILICQYFSPIWSTLLLLPFHVMFSTHTHSLS